MIAQIIRSIFGKPYAKSTNTLIFHTTAQIQFSIMATFVLTVFFLSIPNTLVKRFSSISIVIDPISYWIR